MLNYTGVRRPTGPARPIGRDYRTGADYALAPRAHVNTGPPGLGDVNAATRTPVAPTPSASRRPTAPGLPMPMPEPSGNQALQTDLLRASQAARGARAAVKGVEGLRGLFEGSGMSPEVYDMAAMAEHTLDVPAGNANVTGGGFGLGDVSAGLGAASAGLGLLSAFTNEDGDPVRRALGGAQAATAGTAAVAGAPAVQTLAPGASTVSGIAGTIGAGLGIIGGAYSLSQGDPMGVAQIGTGTLGLLGQAGMLPAATTFAVPTASTVGAGALGGAAAGAPTTAAVAEGAAVAAGATGATGTSAAGGAVLGIGAAGWVAAPLIIGAVANYFAQQADDESKADTVKETFQDIQRTREMASGMIQALQQAPFGQAVHMRMPGEEQDTTIGEVLRAIAERNVRGNFVESGTMWEPNAKYGALIAALDEAGVKSGGYDGAKAEHLVHRAVPGKAKNWGTNAAQGGMFWDAILGPLSDAVLRADPSLAERGPKPPPQHEWMERGLRYQATPFLSNPAGGGDLADMLWALDPSGAMGQTGRLEDRDPRVQAWWDAMAKRTKYQPSAQQLGQLADYRDSMHHGSA